MITRYGPCIGITLFRFLRWKLELWYAPAWYATPEHTHENSSGEFTILWSKNRRIWRRIGERIDSYNAHTPECLGKWLSVRAGTPHAFEKGDSCMIWLCWETWRKGVKVTSLAHDFVLALDPPFSKDGKMNLHYVIRDLSSPPERAST